MKLDIGGEETLAAPIAEVWRLINDPAVLTRCIPGCKSMTQTAPDTYAVDMQLKVASVSGSFAGAVALADKAEPTRCRLTLSGGGTLGHAKGEASLELSALDAASTKLIYKGEGEIGGLVAGVGQRILKGVAKHLVGQFFTQFRKVTAETTASD